MAFPKRDTRRVVVGEETYLWHRDRAWDKDLHVMVGHALSPGCQLLWLDTTAYHFSFGPQTVCAGIEFALAHGWTPTKKGPTLYIGFDEAQFYFLPLGERHPHAVSEPPFRSHEM